MIGTLLIRVKQQTPIVFPAESSKYPPRHSPSPSAHVSKPKHESTRPSHPTQTSTHDKRTHRCECFRNLCVSLPQTLLPVRSAFTQETSRRLHDTYVRFPRLRRSRTAPTFSRRSSTLSLPRDLFSTRAGRAADAG